MPSDTALDAAAVEQNEPRRLPVGIGLTVAVGSSMVLWSLIAIGVKSLPG